jgi:hypothetical protein
MRGSKTVNHESADSLLDGTSAKSPGQPLTARGQSKWQEQARARLRTTLKQLSKPLAEAVARDANEADTRLLVTEFLCEGLGYHRFEDLDTEYAVKGQFADYGLRIDKQLVAFVEVKRSTTKLVPRHLRQVELYAVNEGVEWIVLTNAVTWQLYHLQGGLPANLDLVLAVDLLSGESIASLATKMLPMTREATRRGVLDSMWKQARATSPQVLVKAILAPSVIRTLRRELHHQTGNLVAVDDLARVLRDTVIRPNAL